MSSPDFHTIGQDSTELIDTLQLETLKTNSKNDLYCQNIPLPKILTKHLMRPSASLMDRGKLIGFRIQTSARIGGKSGSVQMSRGRIGSKSFDLANPDYGKSIYVEKLGVSGIKVWTSYQR